MPYPTNRPFVLDRRPTRNRLNNSECTVTKMAGTFGSGIKWTYDTTILKFSIEGTVLTDNSVKLKVGWSIKGGNGAPADLSYQVRATIKDWTNPQLETIAFGVGFKVGFKWPSFVYNYKLQPALETEISEFTGFELVPAGPSDAFGEIRVGEIRGQCTVNSNPISTCTTQLYGNPASW
jgi:hypothetical protein